LMTFGLNQLVFSTPSLANETGLTAQFSHNKYFYLSMPKFDMDVFLSKGGNMEPEKVLVGTDRFIQIKDENMRAALISIIENPKSVALNTLQKADSYLFSVQKNPQLPGEYYLSPDQKSIIIGDERLSWTLILGNIGYFIYRALLQVFFIIAATLYFASPRIRKQIRKTNSFLLLAPFICGLIPGLLFYTESRFKVVAELLLVPLIIMIMNEFRNPRRSEIDI